MWRIMGIEWGGAALELWDLEWITPVLCALISFSIYCDINTNLTKLHELLQVKIQEEICLKILALLAVANFLPW